MLLKAGSSYLIERNLKNNRWLSMMVTAPSTEQQQQCIEIERYIGFRQCQRANAEQ